MDYDYEVCESDESVADIDGDTCSSYYDANPEGCGGYDTEDFIAARECCVCGGGSTGYYEEDFSWYMYLTSEDQDAYAMIWTEDEEFNTMYVWDESGAICTLTTDWISEDPMDGAWGFVVSDPNGTCPYVESEGWIYAWYTADAEWNPVSIVGPYGNTWYFTDAEEYENSLICYNDDSVSDVDGDTCSNYYDSNPDGCGNFDFEGFTAANSCCACGGGSNGSYEDSSDDDMWYWINYLTNDEVDGYGVIWTYDQELNEFELAFTGGEMDSWCTLTTDWKTDDMEDGAWGFFVTATYGDEYCSFVEDEGWVYASLTSDEEGNPLTLEGPYGN